MKRYIKANGHILPKVSYVLKVEVEIGDEYIESSINDSIRKIPKRKYKSNETLSKETLVYNDFISELTSDLENILGLHVYEARPSTKSNTSMYYSLMMKTEGQEIDFDVRIIFEVRVSDHDQMSEESKKFREQNRSFNTNLVKQLNHGKLPEIPDELSINILDNEFDSYEQAKKFILFSIKTWMDDQYEQYGFTAASLQRT